MAWVEISAGGLHHPLHHPVTLVAVEGVLLVGDRLGCLLPLFTLSEWTFIDEPVRLWGFEYIYVLVSSSCSIFFLKNITLYGMGRNFRKLQNHGVVLALGRHGLCYGESSAHLTPDLQTSVNFFRTKVEWNTSRFFESLSPSVDF